MKNISKIYLIFGITLLVVAVMPDIDILDINLPLSILLIFSLKVILQLFVLFAVLLIYTL